MATTITCPIEGCEYSTGEHSEAVAIAYLNAHMYAHQQPRQAPALATPSQPGNVIRGNGPKLDRPRIEAGVSMEDWIMFKRRWKIYKEGSNIPDSQASHHLFQCADTHLGDALLKTDPDIANKSINQVLAAMQKLAVIPVAIGILRAELLDMKQERDETFRKFSSRVKDCHRRLERLPLSSPSPKIT